MQKKILLLLIFSFIVSLSIGISVNANSDDEWDAELNKIANAQTVYMDKSFNVIYNKKSIYSYDDELTNYYKIDIEKNALAILDIQYSKINADLEEDDICYFYIYYLSEGSFQDAETIDSNKGNIYILDKNKDYYLYCRTNISVKVTLHNKVNDITELKKENNGRITKDFEHLYKFKTNSNNETILREKYSSQGATIRCYVIGLDEKNNCFVYYAIGAFDVGKRDTNWHDILQKNKEYFVFAEVEKYTISTDYTLSYICGPESKNIEKAKFKKKYKGSTFGYVDYYKYKLKQNYKTKIKIQITGKNIVVSLNGKKIKCKKKVTKTLWVDPQADSFLYIPTYLNVYVYQKGWNYNNFYEKNNDYSIKITKLKVKKRK